jgi:hypothetical protein
MRAAGLFSSDVHTLQPVALLVVLVQNRILAYYYRCTYYLLHGTMIMFLHA